MARMRLGVLNAANLHEYQLTRGGFRYKAVMITLTYREVGQATPKDITGFNKRVKQWMWRRGLDYPYVWVAELQERGALHYHLIVWLPLKFRLPKPDKAGWWEHGSTRIEEARCAVGYIAKYASKLKSKLTEMPFPAHFRMHGSGGLDADNRQTKRFVALPGWLRCMVTQYHEMRRVSGGWISRVTGEFWHSLYQVVRVEPIPGRGAFIHLRESIEGAQYPCTQL